MNLVCPSCQKMVFIGDSQAGQLVHCPLCNSTFTAPMLGSTPPTFSSASSSSGQSEPSKETYSLTGTPGAHAAGSSATDSSRTASVSSSPVMDTPSSEYTHRYIIWISPRFVPWIAPVALGIVFFLLFFPWALHAENSTVTASSGWAQIVSSPLWIFYFLLYLVALALSIGSLLLTLAVVPALPQIAHLVPWKTCIVAGAVAFAFLLLYIGFWGEPLSTSWFRWTVWLHLVALIGLGLEYCLERRGPSQALPRIDILW